MPFVTGWMGENHFAPLPTAVYGVVLLCAAIAYTILQRAIIRQQGPHSKLAAAVQGDVKGKISALLYLVAIPMALVNQLDRRRHLRGRGADWLVAGPADRIEAGPGMIWTLAGRMAVMVGDGPGARDARQGGGDVAAKPSASRLPIDCLSAQTRHVHDGGGRWRGTRSRCRTRRRERGAS